MCLGTFRLPYVLEGLHMANQLCHIPSHRWGEDIDGLAVKDLMVKIPPPATARQTL